MIRFFKTKLNGIWRGFAHPTDIAEDNFTDIFLVAQIDAFFVCFLGLWTGCLWSIGSPLRVIVVKPRHGGGIGRRAWHFFEDF